MTDRHLSGAPEFSGDKFALLGELLAEEGLATAPAAAIVPGERPTSVPLSFAQELVWLLDRANPGMTAYNSGLARRLRGPLDLAAVQSALDALAARHEILRTTFVADGDEGRQVVRPPLPVALDQVDLSHLAPAEREAEARTRALSVIRTPFDLAHEPAFRGAVIRLGADDHVLAFGLHHIAIDGWSRGVLFREFSLLYNAARLGKHHDLPPLAVQYADYAIWQRSHLSGAVLDALLAYWRDALDGTGSELALPTDFLRPAHASFEGAQIVEVLPPELAAAIRQFARHHDATLYMVLLAAYHCVLHRWTGQADIVTGSPVAGRALPETTGTLGYFANTLAMRSRLGDDPPFETLLSRTRETVLQAFEHQDVPLEKLVLELRETQDRPSNAALFQAVLTMHDMPPGDLQLDGLDVQPIGVESDSSKFDFTLIVSDRPDQVRMTLHYRTDLFRAETARRFLGHLQQVLRSATEQPGSRISQLQMLTPSEVDDLARWNRTAVALGEELSIPALFGRWVATTPAAIAVAGTDAAGTDVTLTYAELDARADRLARALRAQGMCEGAPVCLLFERRTVEIVVAVLGVLKAGGCYVPLSADSPPARIAQQVAECGATVAVTDHRARPRLPATISAVLSDGAEAATDARPLPAVSPAALAYVLFTSGSTGAPKGVAVSHANIVHYARAISRVLAVTEPTGDPLRANRGLQCGMVSSFAADLGNTAFYPALLGGGTLHLLDEDAATDPARFADTVSRRPLDLLKITPNHWHALTAGRQGDALRSVLPRRWLILGGEALRPDVVVPVLATGGCRVLNHYGPTETTVGACTFEVTRSSLDHAAALGAVTVPIGRPLANGRAFVVDASGAQQPVGIPGELLLGGPGVADGYFRRPDLTAERFVIFGADRVYRTGDRVRRLADGTLEFLGRLDDQLKIRGFRVELGEIEQAITAHDGVARCALLVDATGPAETTLTAFVVPHGGYATAHAGRVTSEGLREWIAARVPGYMVPPIIVLLDDLPLTANGKIDRAALAARRDAATNSTAFVEPATETERTLAAIWSDVLKAPRISAVSSFLDLGGHSLLAIRVLGRVSKAFGVRLPLRTLFEAPTVQRLAVAIEAARAGGANGAPVPITPRARPRTSGGTNSGGPA